MSVETRPAIDDSSFVIFFYPIYLNFENKVIVFNYKYIEIQFFRCKNII